MEIRFCDRCDSSIPKTDLDRGAARRVGGRLLCAACRLAVTRMRLARYLLVPAALLAAAALGAAAAVLLLEPRLEDLEGRVARLSAARGVAPGVDPALLREIGALRDLIRENVEAGRREREAALRAQGELAEGFTRALESITRQVGVLAEEIRAVKARVREAPPPGTGEEGGGEGEPARAEPDVEALLELTEDEDAGARLSALLALAESRDPRVGERILELLQDTDHVVRAEAARILGRRGEERAITPLIERLADEEILVRAAARTALLALTGSDHGFDASDPPEVRRKAVEAFRAWDRDRRK